MSTIDDIVGSLIFQPSNTTNQVISLIVNSDLCPIVLWSFEGTPITEANSDYILSDPCGIDAGVGDNVYTFNLTIVTLTEATSGQYTAEFSHLVGSTITSTYVTLPGEHSIIMGMPP